MAALEAPLELAAVRSIKPKTTRILFEMTELLFRDDAYRREAEVLAVESAPGRIVLDSTVFYAQGGGQPGDRGELVLADGSTVAIVNAMYDADRKTIMHVPAECARLPAPGERVTARLDWELRYKRMRAHTALHLLSVVLPYPVTGGSVGDGEGRLDFDSGEVAFDKADIESRLEALVATDAAVTTRWITAEELAANPGLVKTMKVKPPTGSGRVRLVEIAGLDLQPCGGTHVARVREVGRVTVAGIEKKGKLNRRVRIALG
jgi:misacylated tRNA(Ala) deacylase